MRETLFHVSSLLPKWQTHRLCPSASALSVFPSCLCLALCVSTQAIQTFWGRKSSVSLRAPRIPGCVAAVGAGRRQGCPIPPSPHPLQPLVPPQPMFAHSPGKHFTGKNLCQVPFQRFGFNKLLLTTVRGLVSQGRQPSLWKVITGTR